MRFRAAKHGDTMLMLEQPELPLDPYHSQVMRIDEECRAYWTAAYRWCSEHHGGFKPSSYKDSDDGWTWAYFGYYPVQRHLWLYSGIYFKRREDAFEFKLRWG